MTTKADVVQAAQAAVAAASQTLAAANALSEAPPAPPTPEVEILAPLANATVPRDAALLVRVRVRFGAPGMRVVARSVAAVAGSAVDIVTAADTQDIELTLTAAGGAWPVDAPLGIAVTLETTVRMLTAAATTVQPVAPAPPAPPNYPALIGEFKQRDAADVVSPGGSGADGVADVWLRVRNVTGGVGGVSIVAGSNVWAQPMTTGTLYAMTVPVVGEAGVYDLYLSGNAQWPASYDVTVRYADGAIRTVSIPGPAQPAPTPLPPMTATLLGREGDFTNQSKLEADGKLDVHIQLKNVPAAITKLTVRDNRGAGAFWTHNAANSWIVAIKYADNNVVDLYFTYASDFAGYNVELELANGVKTTLAAAAPTVPAPEPEPTPEPEPEPVPGVGAALWYPVALPAPTAPAGFPFRAVVSGITATQVAQIKQLWVYGPVNVGNKRWWQHPFVPNGPGKVQLSHAGNVLTVWCENKPVDATPIASAAVTIAYQDGTTADYQGYWDGSGATAWPTVAEGCVPCPVVSIMQHENQPPVTSQYAHLVRGVLPGLDFVEVTLDVGHLPGVASADDEIRYTCKGVPVTPWVPARTPRAKLHIDAVELGALSDGNFHLSFEMRGPRRWQVLPMFAQLQLSRVGSGKPFDPKIPIFHNYAELQDPVNVQHPYGVAYVDPADLKKAGRPIVNPVYTAWGPGTPPRAMRVSALSGADTLFRDQPMLWSRRTPVDGQDTPACRGWSPKHNESPKALIRRNSKVEPAHATFPVRGGYFGVNWFTNYGNLDGIWHDTYGWAATGPEGCVYYVARDGLVTVLVGWEVQPDKYPIWPFADKPVEKIRANMVLRGSGADLPATGLGGMMDVASDPSDPGRIIVPDMQNHAIYEVRFDPANPGARGVVTLLAGKPGSPGMANGAAKDARFSSPISVSISKDGKSIVIADADNDRLALLRDGVVTTIRATPEMRQKYPATTPPWTIREKETLTGTGYMMYSPQFVRFNIDGEVVFSDLGTSTIRAVNLATGAARMIYRDGNFRLDVGGWQMHSIDWQGNGRDLYFVTFTGSLADDSKTPRAWGPLNEAIQYLPDNGTGKIYPVFTSPWDFDPGWAQTVGCGISSQAVSPHYAWWCSVHPKGAIAVNGGGTHGTLILTKHPGWKAPTHAEFAWRFYTWGRPGVTPPILTFGTLAQWAPMDADVAYISSRYADWGKLTTAEQTALVSFIKYVQRGISTSSKTA